MPVTTTSAAIHITPGIFIAHNCLFSLIPRPVVIKTFFTHGRRKAQRLAASKDKDKGSPQDDIFFDQYVHLRVFLVLDSKTLA